MLAARVALLDLHGRQHRLLEFEFVFHLEHGPVRLLGSGRHSPAAAGVHVAVDRQIGTHVLL